MPKALNLGFFAGALLLVGMAWGLKGYRNPHHPSAMLLTARKAVNPFAEFVQKDDPRAELRSPGTRAVERWGENDPVAAQPGRDPTKRHLPIYRYRHTDGHVYFVQSKDEALADFTFFQIQSHAGGQYLPRLRGRIIQSPFDMFDEVTPDPPPIPPPKRPGLFDDIPITWPGSNRMDQPPGARR